MRSSINVRRSRQSLRRSSSSGEGATTIVWAPTLPSARDSKADLRRLFDSLEADGIPLTSISAVGYRVVHGGPSLRAPVRADPAADPHGAVIREIGALRRLAPLHNGVAAATMRAGLATAPGIPHVAVFDTAFHATLPEEAWRYPLPREWYAKWGVLRIEAREDLVIAAAAATLLR